LTTNPEVIVNGREQAFHIARGNLTFFYPRGVAATATGRAASAGLTSFSGQM